MKRAASLFFAAAVLLTLAPAALANHCYNCKFYPEPTTEPPQCIRYYNYAFMYCEENYDTGECDVEFACGNHTLAPLASDFAVASVERLDEPRTSASDTLMAAARPAAPATR